MTIRIKQKNGKHEVETDSNDGYRHLEFQNNRLVGHYMAKTGIDEIVADNESEMMDKINKELTERTGSGGSVYGVNRSFIR